MKIVFCLVLLAGGLTAGIAVSAQQSGHRHEPSVTDTHPMTMPAAPEMASGEVLKIDTKARKLTLRHGRIEALNMGPMTMIYRVTSEAWLPTLAVGDQVQFSAKRMNGYLTVTVLEKAKP